jgi:hypothetical protein
MGKRRISTFSQTISEEQAETEKQKNSSLGKSLKKADELYRERRKK